MAKWIQTPKNVIVNENAVAEFLPPRELGTTQYVVEAVMLNTDPSRQDRRELCRGTKEECEAFLDDLKADLEIIPKPKKKPAPKAKSTTTKAATKTEADADDAPSEA